MEFQSQIYIIIVVIIDVVIVVVAGIAVVVVVVVVIVNIITKNQDKQGRIHGLTVVCCWAGAVMQITNFLA